MTCLGSQRIDFSLSPGRGASSPLPRIPQGSRGRAGWRCRTGRRGGFSDRSGCERAPPSRRRSGRAPAPSRPGGQTSARRQFSEDEIGWDNRQAILAHARRDGGASNITYFMQHSRGREPNSPETHSVGGGAPNGRERRAAARMRVGAAATGPARLRLTPWEPFATLPPMMSRPGF